MYEFDRLWDKDVSRYIIDGNIAAMEEELARGWNINDPLKTYALQSILKYPILLAVQYQNFDSVRFLVEHKSKLDFLFRNYTPQSYRVHTFFYAVQYANEEIIRYIASKGAKLCDSGGTSAYDIAYAHNDKCIDLINEIGLPVIPYGIDAFLRSIDDRNYRIAKKFIEEYGLINESVKTKRNFYGNTALCCAAINGDTQMIEFLIANGADPLKPNLKGERPYNLAFMQKHNDCVKLFKKYEKKIPDVIEAIPEDYREFAEKGQLRVENNQIEPIDFLDIDDIYPFRLGKRKLIVLSDSFGEYPDVRILWNTVKNTVAYYDIEMRDYGEFNVSFAGFIHNIDFYIQSIFIDTFWIAKLS